MTSLRRTVRVGLLIGLSMALATGAFLEGGAQAAETPIKIAVVDLNRVLNESNPGKQAMAQLQAQKDKIQAQINRKEDEVRRLQSELRTQGLVLSNQVRRQKELLYRRKLRDAQRFVDDANDDLSDMEQQATAKVLSQIRQVIQKMGKDHGYTLILDRRQGIYYIGNGIDITDSVIRQVNAVAKH